MPGHTPGRPLSGNAHPRLATGPLSLGTAVLPSGWVGGGGGGREAPHAAPWIGQVGLFFHVYPHNSVQSFHLHIVDLDATGPTYEVMKYKNMPAEDVLAVLRAEAAGQL